MYGATKSYNMIFLKKHVVLDATTHAKIILFRSSKDKMPYQNSSGKLTLLPTKDFFYFYFFRNAKILAPKLKINWIWDHHYKVSYFAGHLISYQTQAEVVNASPIYRSVSHLQDLNGSHYWIVVMNAMPYSWQLE